MTLQKIEFEYDIPYGYKFVRFGRPSNGDLYLNSEVKIHKALWNIDEDWIIIEKIPEKEQNNKQKFQYRPSSKEEWIDLYDGYEYRIKPKTKTVRFRNYLSVSDNIKVTTDNAFVPKKWLGDWQEAEVEE